MNNVKVTVSEKYGREITANKFIYQNDTIMVCELLILSANDTKVINQTDLQYYTFKYNSEQDCLVLGLGEIFNHSDTPNAKYELGYVTSLTAEGYKARQVMKFIATKDIGRDEQIFIDYNLDTQVDTTSYVNKNLV